MSRGYKTDYRAALVATVVEVLGSAGRVYAVVASNPNTVSIWIQVFDALAVNVTLGTTTPKMTLLVPKGVSATDAGGMDKFWMAGIAFDTAISMAATTTPGGSTAPGIGLNVNTLF